MIQLIVGIVALVTCGVPSLRDTPLIWCASWASGILAGRGILQLIEDRRGQRDWDELRKFQESLGGDGPDRAG